MKVEKDCLYLMPENPNYPPIKVTEENELIIWGIVNYVIKSCNIKILNFDIKKRPASIKSRSFFNEKSLVLGSHCYNNFRLCHSDEGGITNVGNKQRFSFVGMTNKH
jgi:hypothetical protein